MVPSLLSSIDIAIISADFLPRARKPLGFRQILRGFGIERVIRTDGGNVVHGRGSASRESARSVDAVCTLARATRSTARSRLGALAE